MHVESVSRAGSVSRVAQVSGQRPGEIAIVLKVIGLQWLQKVAVESSRCRIRIQGAEEWRKFLFLVRIVITCHKSTPSRRVQSSKFQVQSS
jgi:hypothetical protein